MDERVRAMWQVQEHQCLHDWHGYSQPGRYGDGEGACEVDTCVGRVSIPQGDRDCTSSVKIAAEAAGIPTGAYHYTGNLRDALEAVGWVWHPKTDPKIMGDVMYYHRGGSDGHAAMCDGRGRLGEFYLAEGGGIDGAVGDQTGWESRIVGYYDPGWDGFMRFEGDEDMPTVEEIWSYPINGVQARDRLQGIDAAANKSAYQWTRTDDAGSGMDTGADAYTRIAWMDAKLDELTVQTAGLSEAVRALSAMHGADPDEVAGAVAEAVAAKLEGIRLEVSAG